MDIFTLDFETYYDKLYSLSRISTEAYVYDEQFQIIMVSLKKNDEETEIFSANTEEEYTEWLKSRGVHHGAVVAHNMMFDGLILMRLGVHPRFFFDTLGMAQRVLKPKNRSISLDSCLKHTNSPFKKGGYVGNMLGRRLESLTKEEFQRYADYCKTDTDACRWLFTHLVKMTPKKELRVIDATLRMYLYPSFVLDRSILKGILVEEKERSERLLKNLPEWAEPEQLRSNVKFAQLLKEKLQIDPPVKISPTTSKATWAFSKNDEAWKEFEDEWGDDPIVGALIAARLNEKSTIVESRTNRFLEIAERFGKLRVPLRYFGAHTGRYGGMEKINCQNPPRVRPKGSRNQLRFSMAAAKGCVILACDLSQIEARIVTYLAGCERLLRVFQSGGDPYCDFASIVYKRTITKEHDPAERFVGKTCILGLGYGMGYKKLRATFRKDGRRMGTPECYNLVTTYRNTYYQIPAFWKECDRQIEKMAAGDIDTLADILTTTGSGIILPDGNTIHYHNIRKIHSPKYSGWVFDFAGRTKKLWGGIMTENIVQALARSVLMDMMLQIKDELGINPILNVHDELVYSIPEKDVEEFQPVIEEIMSQPPSWAPDLPVGCESAFGPTFGDCK